MAREGEDGGVIKGGAASLAAAGTGNTPGKKPVLEALAGLICR